MTDASSFARAAELWTRLWLPWTWVAPNQLSQPINPGWSFGNVIVNERNSGAPSAEQAIVAEVSYGRQIGKLLDAVYELCRQRPDVATNTAFQDIAKLRDKVEQMKRDAAAEHVDQLRHDLELLKASGKRALEENAESLRSLLPEILASMDDRGTHPGR
jgi:hypothetical protein